MGSTAYDISPVLLLTVLLSFHASFVSAATYIEQSRETRVQNQYIVALREGVNVGAFVEKNFRGENRLLYDYSAAFDGLFSAYMDDNTKNQLLRNEDVDYIEEDGVVTAQAVASWGLDRVDQRDIPLDNYKAYQGDGSCSHIYIIDTGTETAHSQFSGRTTTENYDFEAGPGGATVPAGVDCNGHGTHCGGTAAGKTYGVATGATIHSVKVLNCGGSGTWSSVLGGMCWVVANAVKPAVASMSLVGGHSPSINNAVTTMTNAGIVVSVAAGNWNINACSTSPASAPEAITVGATDANDNRAWFSNHGPCLDIFAPGVQIKSAWKNGGTNTIDGTSMACPHVTGAAAILRDIFPAQTPAFITNYLVNNLATPNEVNNPGPGSPNLLLYIGSEFCNPNPCRNGGICTDISFDNCNCNTARYRCACPRFCYGEKCENCLSVVNPYPFQPAPIQEQPHFGFSGKK